MKNKIKLLTRRIFALMAVICLLSALCIPCFASDVTTTDSTNLVDANLVESQDISGINQSYLAWQYEFVIYSSIFAEPFIYRGMESTTTIGDGVDLTPEADYFDGNFCKINTSFEISRYCGAVCEVYNVTEGITGMQRISRATATIRGGSFYIDLNDSSFGLDSYFALNVDYASHLEMTFSLLGDDTIYTISTLPTKETSINLEDICDLVIAEGIDIGDGIVYVYDIAYISEYINNGAGTVQSGRFYGFVSVASWRFPKTQIEYRAMDIVRGGGGTVPDLPDAPDAEGIPDWLFLDYTSWIGTAVAGFMNFELVPYFSLGMVLTIILAFTLTMWWLKMFGGG